MIPASKTARSRPLTQRDPVIEPHRIASYAARACSDGVPGPINSESEIEPDRIF
jgi:hypothetical protein